MRSGLPGVEEILGLTPLLLKPVFGEKLYLYLVVSESAVSGALVREKEGTQKPIYYVSHTMNGP